MKERIRLDPLVNNVHRYMEGTFRPMREIRIGKVVTEALSTGAKYRAMD